MVVVDGGERGGGGYSGTHSRTHMPCVESLDHSPRIPTIMICNVLTFCCQVAFHEDDAYLVNILVLVR